MWQVSVNEASARLTDTRENGRCRGRETSSTANRGHITGVTLMGFHSPHARRPRRAVSCTLHTSAFSSGFLWAPSKAFFYLPSRSHCCATFFFSLPLFHLPTQSFRETPAAYRERPWGSSVAEHRHGNPVITLSAWITRRRLKLKSYCNTEKFGLYLRMLCSLNIDSYG